jgi:hypothetical protein
MEIEITLALSLCTYVKDFNDTLDCNNTEAMRDYENQAFIDEIHANISRFLGVSFQRIQNFTILNHFVANQTVLKKSDTESMQVVYADENNHTQTTPTYDISTIEQIEYLKVKFLLLSRLEFQNKSKNELTNRETITLFYFMVMHSLDKTYLNVIGDRQTYLSDVSVPDKEKHGWCAQRGDRQLNFRGNFLILASFDEKNAPIYYIYVNETQTLYGSGYFQLAFYMGNLKKGNSKSVFRPFENSQYNFSSDKYQIISDHYSNVNQTNYLSINLILTDVTNMFIKTSDEEEHTKASEILTKELLTVCSIAPKIRTSCENFKTIRIRLCELEKLKDGTLCSIKTKFCYTIDEYQLEYDNESSVKFIRVCERFKPKRPIILNIETVFDKNSLSTLKNKLNLMAILPGWVSVGALTISLIAMIATLFTYALFSELRNVPGWNIINLNVSLIIAQLTFLFGSFFNEWPLFCFIISLLTHFGFLSSFFWMNVIAFDLHRNFRKNASHLLLQMISVKDRLPKYAAYAWLTPLLIVLVCLTMDLCIKENKLNAPFKPCYADYLTGCARDILNDDSNRTFNLTESSTLKDESCDSQIDSTSTIIFLNTACWIRSGKANLIFFGAPLLIIIVLNGVFFGLTIYNIRQKKLKQSGRNDRLDVRRFSRHKLPTDRDVYFYIRISSIMGFQWITGFFLVFFNFSYENTVHEILRQILIYLFILSGSSVGLFIFIAFIFKHETKCLYQSFLDKHVFKRFNKQEKSLSNKCNNKIRHISANSLSSINESMKTRSTNSSLVSTTTSSKDSFNESFESIMVESSIKGSMRSNDDVFLNAKKKVKF